MESMTYDGEADIRQASQDDFKVRLMGSYKCRMAAIGWLPVRFPRKNIHIKGNTGLLHPLSI